TGRIGNVVGVGRRHFGANGGSPRRQLGREIGRNLGHLRIEIASLGRVSLYVVEFAPSVLVKLDQLVIALTNGPAGLRPLIGIMRVVPEEGSLGRGFATE